MKISIQPKAYNRIVITHGRLNIYLYLPFQTSFTIRKDLVYDRIVPVGSFRIAWIPPIIAWLEEEEKEEDGDESEEDDDFYDEEESIDEEEYYY